MSNHLVGVAEVAEMFGVSRQRVHQLSETAPDFPKPEVEVAAGRIWRRVDIEAWLKAHPVRRPGPRPQVGK